MDLMPIRLLGNRLIVRRIPWQQVGSITLPKNLQDDWNTGGPKLYWVMHTGPGRLTKKGVRVPIECEYGDRVVLYSHTEGAEYVGLPDGDVIVTDTQILLVLPKEPQSKGSEQNGEEEKRQED